MFLSTLLAAHARSTLCALTGLPHGRTANVHPSHTYTHAHTRSRRSIKHKRLCARARAHTHTHTQFQSIKESGRWRARALCQCARWREGARKGGTAGRAQESRSLLPSLGWRTHTAVCPICLCAYTRVQCVSFVTPLLFATRARAHTHTHTHTHSGGCVQAQISRRWHRHRLRYRAALRYSATARAALRAIRSRSE